MDLSQEFSGFGISPSIDDQQQHHHHRYHSALSSTQPNNNNHYYDEQNMIEFDLQSDPNLTLQEKIFCQLLLEDLQNTENDMCVDCCVLFNTSKKKAFNTS